jgi:hypothetical protein
VTDRSIYLDYHATTPVDPRVAELVVRHMVTDFGNASSVDHAHGDAAAPGADMMPPSMRLFALRGATSIERDEAALQPLLDDEGRLDESIGRLIAFDGQAVAIATPNAGEYFDDNIDMPSVEGTNIADAIRLGMAMFPGDTSRRLVLASSGNQTIGDAIEAARQAAGGEAATGRAGPLDEQGDRLGAGDHLGVPAGRGQGEGLEPVDDLAVDPEGLARRGEDVHPLAAAQDPLGELGDRLDDVLAVVQQEDEVATPERLDEQVAEIAVGLLADPEHLRDRPDHRTTVGHPGELDEPHAVVVPLGEPPPELDGEPCLADPAGPGDGDEAVRGEQRLHRVDRFSATHERAELGGEVVARGPERAGGREVVDESRRDDLDEALRLREILQAVLAEVAKFDVGRQLLAHGVVGAAGEDDLTPVSGVGHPGGAVHVEPDVAGALPCGAARVDPHADPDVLPGRPGVTAQRSLGGDERTDRRRRRREGEEERVALVLDLRAAGGGDRRADEVAVLAQDPGVVVTEATEESGGALDVREGERHRAGGQIPSLAAHWHPRMAGRRDPGLGPHRRGGPRS